MATPGAAAVQGMNEQLILAINYLIDLGPEAAEKGGMIVAKGTPKQVAATKGSLTGEILRQQYAAFPAE